jgi:hypothetical protein
MTNPICPECGERHDALREITEEERRYIAKKINKLMSVLYPLGPEYTLRILVSLLSFAASKMNFPTRRNVVGGLADNLEIPITFSPPPSALAQWVPQGPTDPKDVN